MDIMAYCVKYNNFKPFEMKLVFHNQDDLDNFLSVLQWAEYYLDSDAVEYKLLDEGALQVLKDLTRMAKERYSE